MGKLPPHTYSDGPYVELDELGLTEQDVEDAVVSARAQVAARRKSEQVTGRPSLTGRPEHSPHLAFRVDPDTRDRVQELADVEGVSASTVARRALVEYLDRHPKSA